MDFRFSEGSLSGSSDAGYSSVEFHMPGTDAPDSDIEVRTHNKGDVPFHVVEFRSGKETIRIFLDSETLAKLVGVARDATSEAATLRDPTEFFDGG